MKSKIELYQVLWLGRYNFSANVQNNRRVLLSVNFSDGTPWEKVLGATEHKRNKVAKTVRGSYAGRTEGQKGCCPEGHHLLVTASEGLLHVASWQLTYIAIKLIQRCKTL